MSDAYTPILEALEHAIGQDELSRRLPRAQAALACLRKTYRSTGCPRYDTDDERLAYALAYHPVHIHMADWAFEQAGPALACLGDRERVNVVFLGAGPGAELVALARFIAREHPEICRIDATLVDRQAGWEDVRAIVGVSRAETLLGGRELRIETLSVDLVSEADRPRLKRALQSADLVVSHAVLSEVASVGGCDTIDWLCATLPGTVPLLLVDLERSRGGRKVFERCQAAGLTAHANTSGTVRVGRPPERLRGPFFREQSDLLARQNAYARVQLLAHVVPLPLRTRPQFVFTSCQQTAREAFRHFLRASDSTPVAMLRGAAGTGKSTLIREFVELSRQAGRLPVLMAPTGHASKRLRSASGCPVSTVHSTLYQHRRTDLDESGGREVVFGPKGGLSGDLWIVDEASLVGDRSVDSDEDAIRLRFHEGKLLTDLLQALDDAPEGTQLVFVGDQYQLPPIDSSHSPALEATALSQRLNVHVPVWELETVTRQAEDSPILRIADRCRSGDPLSELPDLEETDSDRLADHANDFENGSAVVIAWANTTVARFNRTIRTVLGRPSSMPQAGDRLVSIRTTADDSFVNGDEMVVESVGTTLQVSRQLGRTGERVTAQLLRIVVSVETVSGRVPLDTLILLDGIEGHSKGDLEKIERVLLIDARTRFKETKARSSEPDESLFLAADPVFNAVRVVYAYARTCHRAQGGEWDTAIVDVSQVRRAPKGWDYTAVTRARRHLKVIGRLPRLEALDIDVELEAMLVQHGLRSRFKELQHGGRQVDVSDGSAVVQVNVYVRRGVLSEIVRQKGDDALGQRVVPLLQGWAARVREERQPILDGKVTGRLDVALRSFDAGAVQLTRHRIGDWDARIEAVDQSGSATGIGCVAQLRFRYNKAGVLSAFQVKGEGVARECIDGVARLLDSTAQAPRY